MFYLMMNAKTAYHNYTSENIVFDCIYSFVSNMFKYLKMLSWKPVHIQFILRWQSKIERQSLWLSFLISKTELYDRHYYINTMYEYLYIVTQISYFIDSTKMSENDSIRSKNKHKHIHTNDNLSIKLNRQGMI